MSLKYLKFPSVIICTEKNEDLKGFISFYLFQFNGSIA